MTISFRYHSDSFKVLTSCVTQNGIQNELLYLDNKELFKGTQKLKVKLMI